METMDDRSVRRNRRRSPLALLGATAAVVALLVSACGGGGSHPSGVASLGDPATADAGTGDDSGTKTFEDALLELTECMREQGIDMPDPATAAGGGSEIVVEPGAGAVAIDEEEFGAAEKQCGHLMKGFEPDLSPEEMDRMQDEMLTFARCMRERGIDMPDPEVDGGMRVEIGGDGIDPHDPDFQAAEKECRPKGATGVGPTGGPDSEGVVES